jgi:hypothetical protein
MNYVRYGCEDIETKNEFNAPIVSFASPSGAAE